MAKYDETTKPEHTGIVDTIKKYIHKQNISIKENLNIIQKNQHNSLKSEIEEIRDNQQ